MNDQFRPTGFYAFWFERVLKDFVFDIESKINVDLSKKLPYMKKYQTMWNSAYSQYPNSIHYLTFEQTVLPARTEYIRCFLYYFIKNSQKWTSQYIVENDFNLYFNMEDKFEKIESTFIIDLNFILKYSKEQNMKFNELFFTKSGFPIIFKMYFRNEITPFSIIIFQQLFDVFTKINFNTFGIADENKLNNIRIIFDNCYKFIYNNNINWKKIFKSYINSL